MGEPSNNFDQIINVEANPHYYDYLHRLNLFPDATCSFADGGGQSINGIWNGTWKLKDNKIKLVYNEFDNYGDLKPIDPPIIIEIDVNITKEYTKFFNGYCLSVCDETWKFSKSPCPSFVNQQHNHFNLLEGLNEENTPLIFYKNLILGYETDDEILTCPYLRFADNRMWTVPSLDDNIPLIESIKSGFAIMKTEIQNTRQYVKNFIEKNKKDMPFLVDVTDDYTFSSRYSEKQAYEYYRNTHDNELSTFFKNLETLHYCGFNDLYEKFKKTKHYVEKDISNY